MLKHPFKTLAITAALAAAMAISASAASTGAALVETDAPELRLQPFAGSDVITEVPQGAAVVVGGKAQGEWYKVVYRGATGYMSAADLSYYDELDGSFGFGTIRENDALLRTAPGNSSGIIGSLSQGERLSILGVSGQWYKVRWGSIEGYIFSEYIALNGGVSDFPAPADAGQTIVDTAMQYLGVPYVWGGTSPRGFDCSGFVYYVYKECGYDINRTAASIYNNGVYAERDSLQPGDAVCFSSYSNSIGHVGIYIGDGQFIHASSGSGQIIITELDSSYYLQRYVGARRIV